MTGAGVSGLAAVASLAGPHEGQAALFDFALGVSVVGVLFWVLYHLEEHWPERLVRDRGFREDALAIAFAFALAWWLVPFFV